MAKWQSGALVAGILLSTAKGLKLWGVLGPGEGLLMVFVLSALMIDPRRSSGALFRVAVVFWYGLFLCLTVGYLVRSSMIEYQVFPRTMFAYALCAFVALAFIRSHQTPEDVRRSLVYLVVASLFLAACVGVVQILGVSSLAGVDLYWKGTTRFQGWSTDPNQFALLFMATPFFGLHAIRTHDWKGRFGARVAATGALIVLMVVVQRATESDSLLVGWLAGTAFVGIQAARRVDFGLRLVLLLIGIIGGVLAYAFGVWTEIGLLVDSLLGKDAQGDTRLRIWMDSAEIMAQSPIFGLGPEVGPLSPTGGILEAHNNVLHLGMSAGLIGVMLYLGVVWISFRTTLRGSYPLLGAGVIAVFSFGLLHTTVRHPSFWVVLFLLVLVSEASGRLAQGAAKRKGDSSSLRSSRDYSSSRSAA